MGYNEVEFIVWDTANKEFCVEFPDRPNCQSGGDDDGLSVGFIILIIALSVCYLVTCIFFARASYKGKVLTKQVGDIREDLDKAIEKDVLGTDIGVNDANIIIDPIGGQTMKGVSQRDLMTKNAEGGETGGSNPEAG